LKSKAEFSLKKYLPALVCGFGAGVMQIVPFVKGFSCCLVMPIAAFVALLLDQKATNNHQKILSKKAVLFGLFTGLFAALFGTVFELFITLVTKQNDIIATFSELQKMIEGFPIGNDMKSEVLRLFQGVREDILKYGFSFLYTFSILVNNLIINPIFGIAGGLIGAQIINSKSNNSSDSYL
jgi:hypothetical protein